MPPTQCSFRRGTDSAPMKLRCDLSEPDQHGDQHQLQRGPAWTAHSMHTHEWVYRDSDTTTVYQHRHRTVSPKHKRHSARLSTPEQPRRTAGDSTRHRHTSKWAHQSRTGGPIRPQQRQPTADDHSVIDSPTLHIDNGVSPATIGPSMPTLNTASSSTEQPASTTHFYQQSYVPHNRATLSKWPVVPVVTTSPITDHTGSR